jgi:hypothetical protein
VSDNNHVEYRIGKYLVRMTEGQAAHWNEYGPFVRGNYDGAEIYLPLCRGGDWFAFATVLSNRDRLEEIQLEEAVPVTSSPPAKGA